MGVIGLDWGIKLLHDGPDRCEFVLVVEHIKKRSVIFVYYNDNRFACVLFCRDNQAFESVSGSFAFWTLSPNAFILGKQDVEFRL